MSAKSIWEKETFLIIILIGICLLLYFFRLGALPLGDVDEAQHASTSKDMVLTGDWITPQYNGENFYDKPPLYNWLAAVGLMVLGFNEVAARLPAALLGLGCVLLTYWLARHMFGKLAAFLSALVLATSAEHIILSRVVVHDISLAFCVTLAMTLFFIGFKNERRRKPAFLCGYAALGLAVVAKGPVGAMLPMMAIGLFLIYKRQLRFLKVMYIGWGLIIFLAVAAPWYILISLKNPDYLEYFILKKNIGSFLSRESRHPEPFYYFIPVLMGGLLPWSLFLPMALWRALRAKAALHGDGLIFALIWFGVIFIFFSAATTKLGTYILPLFPAASLLVGALWYDLLHTPDAGLHKGVLFSYLPFAIVIPVALGYLLLFQAGSLSSDTGLNLSLIYFLAVWLLGWVVISSGLVIKKKYQAFIGSVAAMVTTLFVLALLYVIPVLGPLVSCKELALRLDTLLQPGENIRFYLKERPSFLFYTDRKVELLENPQQLKAYMGSREIVYCVFKHDDWQDVADLHGSMQVVAQVADKLIVSNKRNDLE